MTITRSDVEAWYELQRDPRDIINSNDGTVNGASLVIDSPFDKLIGSYDFVSSESDYISQPTFGIFDGSQDFSVSFWFKPDTTGKAGLWFATGENQVWAQWDAYGNQKIRFACEDSNGNFQEVVSNTALSTNQWHHITLVFDTSSGMAVYLNGSSDGSNSFTGTITSNNASNLLGAENFSSPNDFFDGKIGQNVIYSKALSQTEASTISNGVTARGQFPLTDSLKAYYKLDGNADDATGNGNNGTVTGATVTSPGRIGDCYTFSDASNDRISTGINLNGQAQIMIDCWFKRSNYTDTNRRLFGASDGSDFLQAFIDSSDTLRTRLDTTNGNVVLDTTAVTAGKWQHYAMTYDGSTVRVYIDGSQVQSGSLTGDVSVDDVLEIGNLNGSNNTFGWGGEIDEFGVRTTGQYTSGEIRRLYSYGVGLRYEDLYTENPLNDGVLAAYNFDGDVTDAKNNTYDGTNVTAPTYESGVVNKQAVFNGSDTEVSLPSMDGLTGSTAFSAAYWYYNNSNEDDRTLVLRDDVDFILEQGKTASDSFDWWDGSSHQSWYSGVSTNTQYQIGASYDGSTIQFYLDGAQQSSASWSSSNGTGPSNWGNNTLSPNADIDIGCLWVRDLSITEWKEYYNSGNGQQFPYIFTESFTASVSETTTISDTATNKAITNPSETTTLSDTATSKPATSLSETTTLSDSLAGFTITTQASETTTVTDTATNLITTQTSETTTLSDSLASLTIKTTPGETTTLSDTTTNQLLPFTRDQSLTLSVDDKDNITYNVQQSQDITGKGDINQ